MIHILFLASLGGFGTNVVQYTMFKMPFLSKNKVGENTTWEMVTYFFNDYMCFLVKIHIQYLDKTSHFSLLCVSNIRCWCVQFCQKIKLVNGENTTCEMVTYLDFLRQIVWSIEYLDKKLHFSLECLRHQILIPFCSILGIKLRLKIIIFKEWAMV